MNQPRYGPGPVIHGQDIANPERWIVQHNGGPPTLMTATEIAAIPIQHQWFTGTANGLIASWWTREIAEQHTQQIGVLLGQIMPMDASAAGTLANGPLVVLCDAQGNPLRGV